MTLPSLLLLHGALGSADQFDALAARLSDTFDVHRFDFEGHGTLAPPTWPLTMDRFADAVRDHVAAHALAPARVFGYSMGGYAALLCARRYPGTIERIMTLGTKLAWTPDVAAREAGFLDADRLRDRAPAFAAQLAARHGEANWPALLTATRDMLLGLGDTPALSDADWPALDLPVRIAVGDRDATVTVDECVSAYRALPNAQLQVFPRTPHPFERVDVGWLAKGIRGFMASTTTVA
ncbi:MAG: alpha/beta hydrolase [Ardenticatenales bacterium]|nr:alpha/beta hydrolase [Ardenticatenales bacterium]